MVKQLTLYPGSSPCQKAEPGYEARNSLNLELAGGQIHYHTTKTIQKKYLGGRANPLPHHKDTTTNLKAHFKKGEMEGSTKIQSQGFTTSQVLLNRLQIPATALLILGIMFFSNSCTDVDLKTFF